MSEPTDRIAGQLGAKHIGAIHGAGGGAFGAAHMAGVFATLQGRLTPGQGLRPGRPSDPSWSESPKVPMSSATVSRLTELAEQASRDGRKVSPMQLAAQLVEDGLARLPAK